MDSSLRATSFEISSLADRAGLPTALDLTISGIGVVLVLEAARRALGPTPNDYRHGVLGLHILWSHGGKQTENASVLILRYDQ